MIDQTLKVYLEQQALNDQAVAVNSSIIEILRDLSSNDQNGEIIENVDICSESESILEDCLNQAESTSYLERREGVDNETEMKFCKTKRGKSRLYILIRNHVEF